MTRLGIAATVVGVALAVGGFVAVWAAVVVLGVGILVLVAASLAYVLRRPRLAIERQIEPSRVEKGSPAIALVHATNLSRRTLGSVVIEQRVGPTPMRAVLPRLHPGESSLRSYRLPTTKRGVYDIGPVEVTRADPLGLCRTVQRLGQPQRVAVHPRVLSLSALPTGTSRNLEGPSSDTSPQGSITFHRLREYVVGDDLRTVHWPSTARIGKLVVRHNVDTAQPYTVVVTDLRPAVYSAETFEMAVDVTASVLVSMSAGKAPVQLRTTSGTHLGGPAQRDPRPLIDHLTEVGADESGSLSRELLRLRRDRGGTALVVVTGRLDAETLPEVAALRRRFDRVLVASIVTQLTRTPTFPGVAVLAATSADELAQAWRREVIG